MRCNICNDVLSQHGEHECPRAHCGKLGRSTRSRRIKAMWRAFRVPPMGLKGWARDQKGQIGFECAAWLEAKR